MAKNWLRPNWRNRDIYERNDLFAPDEIQGGVLDVAEGGFGRVYIVSKAFGDYLLAGGLSLVQDPKLPAASTKFQDVRAFKTVKGNINRVEKEAFYREAETWLSFGGCPFVLPVTRVIRHMNTGRPYIQMPFCAGSLRGVIDMNLEGVSMTDSIYVMLKCLEGLRTASSRGLYAHLDLKPENILLRTLPAGSHALMNMEPLLADFGLAQIVRALHPARGLSVGYAAPEQYKGWHGEAPGPWSDIYAVGIMLCELATGKHPAGYRFSEAWKRFDETGDWAAWTSQDVQGELDAVLSGTSDAFRSFVQRCIDPDSSKRFRSYPQAQDGLYAVLSEVSSTAWSREFRTVIVEAWKSDISGLETSASTKSAHAIVDDLDDLSRIDRKTAEEEAVFLWERASSEQAGSAERRLGALAANLLACSAARKGKDREAKALAQEAVSVLVALANSGAELEAILVLPQIRDRTAYALASDVLWIMRLGPGFQQWRTDIAYPAAQKEIDGLLARSSRLAPYVCSHLATAFHQATDWGCQFYWKIRAAELNPTEGEFWYVLGIWIEMAEVVQGEAHLTVVGVEEDGHDFGLSLPCPHGRLVPWSGHQERDLLKARWLENASRSALENRH